MCEVGAQLGLAICLLVLLLDTEILAVLLEGLLTLLLRLRNSAPIGVFDTGVHSLRPVRPIVGLRDGYLAYR